MEKCGAAAGRRNSRSRRKRLSFSPVSEGLNAARGGQIHTRLFEREYLTVMAQRVSRLQNLLIAGGLWHRMVE